ncbi:MAG: TonB-dependent receptor [Pararhodobacter sp.]|nr:TonB-dependent receptor [Pararhodobacter sp.]
MMHPIAHPLFRSTALNGATALGLSLAAAPTAQAQIIATIDLDEITVSANLVPTEIQRSGASVSVIERAEIEDSGATQLSDLLARLAGVSMVRDGGPGGRTGLRIRGAAQGYVAVYVDGIRIDDPSSTSTATDFGHLSLDDIERIEVLRGSQSALYGGSAVGGVVNITSRRPETDGSSHATFAEGGSYGSAAVGYSFSFRDERVETSLSLTHRRMRGFTSYEGIPGTPGYNPDGDPDGFESTRLSFSARYRASDSLTLGIAGFGQRSLNEYDDFGADADNEARIRQTGLRAFAEFDTGAMQHEFSATGYRISRDQFEDGAFVNGFEGRRTGLAYQGVTEATPGLTLVWGADTMRESATADTLVGGSESTRTSGAFMQALWAVDQGLDIGATARIDRNSAFGSFVTGRLTAAWQATPDTTLRGALARGFRPPSLSERFDDYGWFVGNPDLEPETSLSAEIGLDHHFAGGARVSATLFWLNTDNLITYDASDFPNTLNNLPGTSRRHGLELSGSVPMTDRLTLTGNYTYTDARTPNGDRLTRVPRHDLSLGLDANLAARWRGGLDLQHVAGRADEFGDSFEDYTVVNARLRYAATDNADIYLRIENLLDADYQVLPGFGTPNRSFHLGVAARF